LKTTLPQILIFLLGLILGSCGQQKVVRSNTNGSPNLVIEDIICQRISSVSYDQFGRSGFANRKKFSFTITVANRGGVEFLGQLSISNTRDDLNHYVHTETASSENVRIGVNEIMSVYISDSFTYSVHTVRFRLGAKPIGINMNDFVIE